MRRSSPVLLALLVLAVAAAPAGAAITRIHIGLTASVTRHVTVTDTDQSCPGATDPMSGELTDTATLTTKRTATVVVIPGSFRSLAIEPQTDMNNSGEILTHGPYTRSSTLSSQGDPTCPGQDPASCGTKQVNLNLRGGPDNGHNGRTFRGISINGGIEDFSDPFSNCRSPDQALPSAVYLSVPFTRAFMVSCKRGKLTHHVTRTTTSTQPGTERTTVDTTVKLSVTVTRLGPLRGYRC